MPLSTSVAVWHGSCYKALSIAIGLLAEMAKKPRRVGTEGPLSLGNNTPDRAIRCSTEQSETSRRV